MLMLTGIVFSPKAKELTPSALLKQGKEQQTNILLEIDRKKDTYRSESNQNKRNIARSEHSNSSSVFQDATTSISLPLKAPFFPEASFYLIQNQAKNNNSAPKKSITLLLVLKTANLGVLRLFLSQQKKNLFLQWVTQTIEVKHYMEQSFAELQGKILDLGYKKVTVKFKHLPQNRENKSFLTSPDLDQPNVVFDLYI